MTRVTQMSGRDLGIVDCGAAAAVAAAGPSSPGSGAPAGSGVVTLRSSWTPCAFWVLAIVVTFLFLPSVRLFLTLTPLLGTSSRLG